MIKLHKFNKAASALGILLSLSLQGCSSKYSNYNPWSVNSDALMNRRAPGDNPGNINQAAVQTPKSTAIQQDFSQSNQAYQRYMVNQPITLKEFDKQKRYPHMNVSQLNTAMDNSATNSTTISNPVQKPVEVNSTSNLKEVIEYNKKQKATNTNDSDSTAVKKAKPKTNKQTEESNNKSKLKSKAIEASKSQVTSANSSTTNATKNNDATPATTTQPTTVTTTQQTSVTTTQPTAVTTTQQTTATTTQPTAVTTTQQTSVTTTQPTAVTATTIPAQSSPKNSSATPVTTPNNSTPIKNNKYDLDKMSKNEVENYLKEKFNDSSVKGFIEKIEDNFSSKNKEKNNKPLNKPAPAPAPITIPGAITSSTNSIPAQSSPKNSNATPVALTQPSSAITTNNSSTQNNSKSNSVVPVTMPNNSTPTNSKPIKDSTPIKNNKYDLDKTNKNEIENYLKEKFNDSSVKGFIEKIEDDFSSKNKEKNNKPLNKPAPAPAPITIPGAITSSNSSPSSINSAPAVSKILTTNSRSKIDKINTLLLECYTSIKNKAFSRIFHID